MITEEGQFGDKADTQYTPMPLATPIPKDEPQGELEIGAAAAEVAERRERELEQAGRPLDAVREYKHIGGPDDGKPIKDNLTVSAEQAAYDLSNTRRLEAEALREAENKALSDAMNSLDQQPVEPQERPQAQNAVPVHEETPQAVEQQQGDDEVVRLLQSNPKLLNAINEQVGQHAAYAEQARQQYMAGLQTNALAALSAVTMTFPELQGLTTPEQIRTAVMTVAKSNLPRAQAMAAHIDGVRNMVQEHQKAAAEYQQQAARNNAYAFQKAAEAADNAFEEHRITQGISDEQLKEIQNEAIALLLETGMTKQEMADQYNSNPQFRGFGFQKILLDATRWRMAQRGAHNKRSNPVPKVVRPGAATDRASREDYFVKGLEDKFAKSGSVKDAAALVASRRQRRG